MRIGGAIFVGIVLISGAFYMRSLSDERVEGGQLTAGVGNARNVIAGSNWESELREMTLRANPNAEEFALNATGTVSAEPKTLTEQFSRSFFESYVRTNAAGALDEGSKEAFLNSSITSLEMETRDTLYTRSDITLGDNEDTRVRAYGNEIAAIINTHSFASENETLILQRALQNDNAEELRKLTNIKNAYSAILTDTLEVAVPPELAEEHLVLVNSYLAIRNDIDAMANAFTDPLYAMLRVKRYQDDAVALQASLAAIYRTLEANGVRYTADEPGASGSWYIKAGR